MTADLNKADLPPGPDGTPWKLSESGEAQRSGAVGAGSHAPTPFHRGRQVVYVVWQGVPAELSGNVTVTDLYGTSSQQPTTQLSPSVSAPILVEPLP